MTTNGNHNATMRHYQQQVREERNLPTLSEVTSYIYSSYTGGEVVSKVEALQDKYPSLRPFIYLSSIMALLPLFIFTQAILLIFSVNLILGLTLLNGYRYACSVPMVKHLGDSLYSMFGNSKAVMKKQSGSKKEGDNDENSRPKTINAGLDKIMKEADSILRGLTDQFMRRAKTADGDSKRGGSLGSSASTLYRAILANYEELKKTGIINFFSEHLNEFHSRSSSRDGERHGRQQDYVSYAEVVKEEDGSDSSGTLKQDESYRKSTASNGEEFESYAEALKEGEPEEHN